MQSRCWGPSHYATRVPNQNTDPGVGAELRARAVASRACSRARARPPRFSEGAPARVLHVPAAPARPHAVLRPCLPTMVDRESQLEAKHSNFPETCVIVLIFSVPLLTELGEDNSFLAAASVSPRSSVLGHGLGTLSFRKNLSSLIPPSFLVARSPRRGALLLDVDLSAHGQALVPTGNETSVSWVIRDPGPAPLSPLGAGSHTQREPRVSSAGVCVEDRLTAQALACPVVPCCPHPRAGDIFQLDLTCCEMLWSMM